MRHTRRLLSFVGAMVAVMALTTGCGGELTPEAEALGEIQSPVSANTRPIYYFTKRFPDGSFDYLYSTSSTEGSSAGYTSEGAPFRLWTYAINGSFLPFYRCLRSNGKHFLTTSYTCEGVGTREGSIGYIATTGEAAVAAGAEQASYLKRYAINDGHYYRTMYMGNPLTLYGYEGIVGYVTAW